MYFFWSEKKLYLWLWKFWLLSMVITCGPLKTLNEPYSNDEKHLNIALFVQRLAVILMPYAQVSNSGLQCRTPQILQGIKQVLGTRKEKSKPCQIFPTVLLLRMCNLCCHSSFDRGFWDCRARFCSWGDTLLSKYCLHHDCMHKAVIIHGRSSEPWPYKLQGHVKVQTYNQFTEKWMSACLIVVQSSTANVKAYWTLNLFL